MSNTMLIGSVERPTLHQIEVLALENPTVHAAMTYYRRLELTLDEALILIIITQAKQVSILQHDLEEYMLNSTRPIVIR